MDTNRRDFLKSSAAVAAAQALPWSTIAFAATQGWRTFETVTRVQVADPFGNIIGLIENPHFTLG